MTIQISSQIRPLTRVSTLICSQPIAEAGYYHKQWRNALRMPMPQSKPIDRPDKPRLHVMMKVPRFAENEKAYNYSRRPFDIRGPEEVHNEMIYRQYALQALDGGNLKYGHIEMMRLQVNKAMDERRMFAVWRIEPPWKSVQRRRAGMTLGGGKRDPHHYVSPVKANRLIFELGGDLHWREAYKIIHKMAHNMPFSARFVSQEMLDEEKKIRQYIEEHNINPFNFEYCAKHNVLGCRGFLSPHTYEWKDIYH